jgi:hypothetical protein
MIEFYNQSRKKHIDQGKNYQCFHFPMVAFQVNPRPNATSTYNV